MVSFTVGLDIGIIYVISHNYAKIKADSKIHMVLFS